MALISVLKYDGGPDVFAWKYPNAELGTWTQLIVNESQEAILFKDGQALDLFTAGRHTLETRNIPLLNKIINLPFGGRSPFAAEVWFVNRVMSLDVKWGTKDPLQVMDPKFNIAVPVRSYGQLGVQISDSRKFLVKLVGTTSSFDKDRLKEYFREILMTYVKDLVAKYLVVRRTSVLEIGANLVDISAYLKDQLNPVFEEFGIRIVQFAVGSISVPEDDPVYQKLRSILVERAEMEIKGFSYQQQRTFDTLEAAAKNEGSGSGLMGAGMGLGMGLGVGPILGGAFAQMGGSIQAGPTPGTPPATGFPIPPAGSAPSGAGGPGPAAPSGKARCDKCGTELPPGARFCPGCGDPYMGCPFCGADNPESAKFCAACGKPLAGGNA